MGDAPGRQRILTHICIISLHSRPPAQNLTHMFATNSEWKDVLSNAVEEKDLGQIVEVTMKETLDLKPGDLEQSF